MIGILTFHGADNFGAVLQNYALLTFLSKNGYETCTINFRGTSITENNGLRLLPRQSVLSLRGMKSFLRNITDHYNRVKKHGGFEEFRSNYLKLTQIVDRNELNEFSKRFDAIIVGSDQIWNKNITRADAEIYFLPFENCKKVAYGASSGSNDMFPLEHLSLLFDFYKILVREKTLKEFLDARIEQYTEVVLDPVFLLTKDEWMSVIPSERLVSEKYIFLYYVGRDVDGPIEMAKNIASNENLKLVTLGYSRKMPNAEVLNNCKPLDFLRLIRDAEIVVAASFHATAFAIVFEKRFISVPHKVTGSRIVDLLQSAEMENHIIDAAEENNMVEIDKLSSFDSNLNDKLKLMIINSKNMLLNAVNCGKC